MIINIERLKQANTMLKAISHTKEPPVVYDLTLIVDVIDLIIEKVEKHDLCIIKTKEAEKDG